MHIFLLCHQTWPFRRLQSLQLPFQRLQSLQLPSQPNQHLPAPLSMSGKAMLLPCRFLSVLLSIKCYYLHNLQLQGFRKVSYRLQSFQSLKLLMRWAVVILTCACAACTSLAVFIGAMAENASGWVQGVQL